MRPLVLFERFEAWLKQNLPDADTCLNPGATSEEITAAETALGVQLPEDARACYALHNGQDPMGTYLFQGMEFLSLGAVVEQWQVWKELLDGGSLSGSSEPEGPVKKDWWNPAWVPFTHDGAGDHLCIDLDPPVEGTLGQILHLWHDAPERPVLAASFTAWFSQYVDDLEAGRYRYSAEHEAIIEREV